jgi:hypothetical protein
MRSGEKAIVALAAARKKAAGPSSIMKTARQIREDPFRGGRRADRAVRRPNAAVANPADSAPARQHAATPAEVGVVRSSSITTRMSASSGRYLILPS